MPNIKRIFLSIFFISFSAFFQGAYSQANTNELAEADSLFSEKKFTEALPIYEKIFFEEGLYSESMLLKLAFIYEGKGDFEQALYVLKYLEQKNNARYVSTKIKELAKKHQLVGYENSDLQALFKFFFNYQMEITSVFLFLGLLNLSILAFRQKKSAQKVPIVQVIPSIVCLLIAIGIWHFASPTKQGIIITDHTILMEAPSAAAEVVELTNKGHLLQLKRKKDVWYETDWFGQTVYVKENMVKTF